MNHFAGPRGNILGELVYTCVWCNTLNNTRQHLVRIGTPVDIPCLHCNKENSFTLEVRKCHSTP